MEVFAHLSEVLAGAPSNGEGEEDWVRVLKSAPLC